MIIFAYLITILTTSCHSQTIGSTVYAMRLLNNSIYAGEHIISFNGSSSLYKTIFLWNGYINVHRDFLVDTMILKMYKCGEGFYPCEYFISFTLRGKDIKPFVTAENQMWSPIYKAVQPKPKIPLMQKGAYKFTNATVDFVAMLTAIPEIAEHTWKVRTTLHEKNSREMICILNQFSGFKYTIHPRNNWKKHIAI